MGKPKQIIIIGAARSGTCMLAEIVSKLGVNMDFTNPIAYESKEVNAINEDLFAIAKGKEKATAKLELWRLPAPSIKRDEGVDNRISIYCKKQKGTWGVKDPRFPLTIEHWLPHLNNPYLLFIFRNPIHATQSWMRAFHMEDWFDNPFHKVLDNYQTYVNAMTKFVTNNYRKYPILTVSYESVLHDVEGNITGIGNFLDLPVTDEAINVVWEKKL